MGTKLHPGEFDCYAAARPDEPIFILMGRDRSAPTIVRAWARQRRDDILKGDAHDRPLSEGDQHDLRKACEAETVADEMTVWRRNNYGVWKGQSQRSQRPQVTESLKADVEDAARHIIGGLAGIPSAFQSGLMIDVHMARVTSSPDFHAFRHLILILDPAERLAAVPWGPIPDGLVNIPGILILDGHVADAQAKSVALELITVPA